MDDPLSKISVDTDQDMRAVIKSLLSEGFTIDVISDCVKDELERRKISKDEIDEVIQELLRIHRQFDFSPKREVI